MTKITQQNDNSEDRGTTAVNKVVEDALCDTLHQAVDNVDTEVVRAILKRPEVDLNYAAEYEDGVEYLYPLDIITVKAIILPITFVTPKLDSAIAIAKMISADHRTSSQHLQKSLFRSATFNFLPIAEALLQGQKSRIDADRTRLDVLRRQSTTGLSVPDEITTVELLPWLGQTIVTQDVFDEIAKWSYSGWQSGSKYLRPRQRRQPMIDLLTTFLREYGNIDDFDIPTVWV